MLDTERRQVSRDALVLVLPRVAGAAREYTLSRRGGQSEVCAYVEQYGYCLASHFPAPAGDSPATRRHGTHSRGAAAVHGRPGVHHATSQGVGFDYAYPAGTTGRRCRTDAAG